MRKLLLLATILQGVVPTVAATTIITPGTGTIADAGGDVWQITADGSILENSTVWIPGGGGTSALTIVDGTVYGKDAVSQQWFTFSPTAQNWTTSPAPAGISDQSIAIATVAAASAAIPTVASTASTSPAACSATYTPLPFVSGVGFHVANGQIIGPNGQPFIARGINIGPQNMGDAAAILSAYKGLNFIRLATQYTFTQYTLAQYQAFAAAMMAKGVVVEFEDHAYQPNGDPAYSGSQLLAEVAWYAQLASGLKQYPNVWFGTMNEPKGDGPTITAQEAAIYAAIRGAGNNTIIMMELPGGGVPAYTGISGLLQAAAFAVMTNVVWDLHYYDWVSNYSSDQTTVSNALTSLAASAQTITSGDGKVPVLVGEYGDSTTGAAIDPGGMQVVSAVINTGSQGQYGSAAWQWGQGGPGDGLLNGDGSLSTYGQAVKLYVGVPCTPTSIAQSQTPSTVVSVSTPAPTDTASGTPAPTAAPTLTSADPSTQSASDQADAIVKQTNTLLQSITGTH